MGTKLTIVAGAALALAAAAPASAAGDNAMKLCGAKYQAAKAGKTLPAGQTWVQFLAACRAGLGGKTVAASTSIKTTTRTTTGQPSAAQLAMRARMKQCSAQWQADKAGHKVAAGTTWPKYWSQCNARMKS